jgi:hypothetical protein
MDFWFCHNDIERYVKGTNCPCILHWPQVLDVWPVLSGHLADMPEDTSTARCGLQAPRLSTYVTLSYVHSIHLI